VILTLSWAVVAHAFNPSTWEAETARFLSSRPAWSTKWVPGQPGLHRETLSQKKKKKKKTNKKNKIKNTFTYRELSCVHLIYFSCKFFGRCLFDLGSASQRFVTQNMVSLVPVDLIIIYHCIWSWEPPSVLAEFLFSHSSLCEGRVVCVVLSKNCPCLEFPLMLQWRKNILRQAGSPSVQWADYHQLGFLVLHQRSYCIDPYCKDRWSLNQYKPFASSHLLSMSQQLFLNF